MALLALYILIALGFSFLCSLLEATLLAITPSAIEVAKQQGLRWTPRMETLKANIDTPLAAILTLNTIAHTMGATGAGAQYAALYSNHTEAAFAALLTLAILVFTEIIPKTLGARDALTFAPPAAWLLPILQSTLAPLVWLCRLITQLITLNHSPDSPSHRDELLAVAQIGEREGQLQSQESLVVHNILKLRDMTAADIMTPRSLIFTLPENTTISQAISLIDNTPFSRIPIYRDSRDDITGFTLRADILNAHIKNPNSSLTLQHLLRPITATHRNTPVDLLFKRLLGERRQILLVANEFGTLVGLLSLEDILETIVGVDIIDETDEATDLPTLARQLWRLRAQRMGINTETQPPNLSDDPDPSTTSA